MTDSSLPFPPGAQNTTQIAAQIARQAHAALTAQHMVAARMALGLTAAELDQLFQIAKEAEEQKHSTEQFAEAIKRVPALSAIANALPKDPQTQFALIFILTILFGIVNAVEQAVLILQGRAVRLTRDSSSVTY
jgi:hypothetical protein